MMDIYLYMVLIQQIQLFELWIELSFHCMILVVNRPLIIQHKGPAGNANDTIAKAIEF